MATTALGGAPVQTSGDLPSVGSAAPSYTLTGLDLGDLPSNFSASRTVLNVFPSIDTGVCASSVRKFNELAGGLDNTRVVCVSNDLPFAMARFCGAEGIDNVTSASAFRSSFGDDYGLTLTESKMAGLLARAVIVVDTDGTVLHSQLVPEIAQEPDYDAAISVLA
ncbi:MAG TPA: thiol peroxidase [Marmoricola sp.]|nr:thiol peroxidase [Marmoricola sp.]